MAHYDQIIRHIVIVDPSLACIGWSSHGIMNSWDFSYVLDELSVLSDLRDSNIGVFHQRETIAKWPT